jgi:Icc-related predicted phosphoesterase
MPDDLHVTVRVAAAGDVHATPALRERIVEQFAVLRGDVDLLLLAGDLTTHGEPEQAAVIADACAGLDLPVLAVLGNHDWHADRRDALVDVLQDGGIVVLDPGHTVVCVRGIEVGIVGAKGFVGGFPGSHLPDFGEPLLREVYAESGRHAAAVDAGLRAVAACALRIVLLHYAPTTQTLVGEPEAIWTFLGTDRLAAPIAEHEPDLVLHGHAHAGTERGEIAGVPVHNVSVPVLGKPFTTFDLEVVRGRAPAVH